jgi:hypothetical protein
MGDLVSEPADSLVAEGLPPGSVWPVLIPPPGYAVTSVSYGGRPVVNTAFDAEARESTVSFVLTSRPAGVTGTVRDANQKPVPEAAVVILPEGMADVGDGTILLRVVLLRSSATSDANGVFHLGNLAPGRYRAVALRGNGDENAADWNFLRKKVSSGERVELDFGQTANLDLRVK